MIKGHIPLIVGDRGEGHQPKPLGTSQTWRLTVRDDHRELGVFSLEDLNALGTVRVETPIVCVSAGFILGSRDATTTFTGVPFAKIAAAVGIEATEGTVIFRSAAPATCGPNHLPHETALELDYCLHSPYTLVATTINDAPLPYANGGPLRSTVGPDRFFYKSVKWLNQIHFTQEPLARCRGSWETYAGYHNVARVAFDERFEPVMLRITAVDESGDVSQAVPEEQWEAVYQEMYNRRDMSKLIVAKIERMGFRFPKDFTDMVFSNGAYRAKLRGCIFQRAQFSGAKMANTNFSLCKFPLATFSTQGQNPADLTGCDLEGAHFKGADLENVCMRDAVLTGVMFYEPRDVEAGVKRRAAKVKGLDLRGSRGLDQLQTQWLTEDGARFA